MYYVERFECFNNYLKSFQRQRSVNEDQFVPVQSIGS